jgi:hypothetical protein
MEPGNPVSTIARVVEGRASLRDAQISAHIEYGPGLESGRPPPDELATLHLRGRTVQRCSRNQQSSPIERIFGLQQRIDLGATLQFILPTSRLVRNSTRPTWYKRATARVTRESRPVRDFFRLGDFRVALRLWPAISAYYPSTAAGRCQRLLGLLRSKPPFTPWEAH